MEGENLSVVSIVPEGYEFVKWTSNAGDGIFDDAFAVSTRIRMQGKSLEVEAVVKKIHSNESETMVPEKETSNVSTEPSASPNSTQPSALPSVNTGADSQSASSTASSGGSSSGSGGGSGAGGGQIGGPSKPFASPTSTQTPEASPEKNEDVQTSVSPVPTAQAEEISSVAGTPKVTEPPKTTERPKVTEPPKATEQPTASPANTQMPNKDSVKEQNTILSKGKTFTKGNFKYKVIKSASRDKKPKAGKVKVIGLSKKGKCALKLKLLTEIIYKNQTFKITKLGKGVFKGAKASVISLPKAVKEIPTAAFVNCKKLKILKIGKLKRVAKGAFKGCKKVITVKGSGKKSNLKKLKQSGYRRFK
ncbi:MAG: leucine-rich repeat protein [Lachnospiraceae bacterium]|nr:leucine-rich repeat protein [Lachnospiraceae bacterium]